MGFMASGVRYNDENASHWADQKQPSITISTYSDNTNRKARALCISVAEDSIKMTRGGVNDPLDYLGCTNSPRHHTYMLRTYRKFPNKMGPYVVEFTKKLIQEYAQLN